MSKAASVESPCIIGWSHSRFGKLVEDDLESLIVTAARDAIAHAGIAAADIDAIFVGLFNNGMSRQDFPASLVLQADEALRFKPATRVENACATGSAAIHAAIDRIRAGRARIALVVGAEKMTGIGNAAVGTALLGAAYAPEAPEGPKGFAGVFGDIASAYFAKYGDHGDALARIAAKNHHNGVVNPYAQLRRDVGFEFCRTTSPDNPMVAAPLRRSDCSPVSDGAAALVIADVATARSMQRAVAWRAAVQVNDFLPLARRDMTRLDGAAEAWRRALGEAGIALEDLDLVESHDCFTIAELMEYEAMGLTPVGQGHIAIEEGWVQRDGKLPVNLSGGLKAKGHPIGATGVSMHVLGAMQVCDAAGAMQLPGATLAGVFNMGGMGVANFVSILERRH